MTSNVVYLHGKPRQIAQVTRVGFREHGLCDQLLSANKLQTRTFIIDASTEGSRRHKSLMRSLKDMGAEVILDTNCAELSVPGRHSGSAKLAPWAVEGRTLEADDFTPKTNRSVIEPIARFAVKTEVTAILAPSHFLGEQDERWMPIDLKSCEALRVALDQAGGGHIPIDYPIIATYGQLRDPAFRKSWIDALRNLPIDRVWLRIAGFGATATGVGIARFIEGAIEFHELGVPLLADCVGGMASLAVTAMGGVSGFASGLEAKQKFDASSWLKPASKGGGGGSKRIFIPGLDRSLSIAEMRSLFESTRTSRTIFGCSDSSCCGDVEKMLRNPEAHHAVQTGKLVRSLSDTPESLRAEQFLEHYVRDQAKTAERATKIRNMDDELRTKIMKSARRLELAYEALAGLHESQTKFDDYPAEAKFRSGSRQAQLFEERSS